MAEKPFDPIPFRLEAGLADNKYNKPKTNSVGIYHAVNPGDLVAAMLAVKKYNEITKRRAIIYQSTNQVAQYYQGAVHPTVNEQGVNVCCNEPMWEMLKPLIESQPYIESFEKYTGQPYDINFHAIRTSTIVNLPNGAIQNWVSLGFPDLQTDISKPWISLDDKCPENILNQVKRKIILNFTERYRNVNIDYYFLQNYAPDLIFAGTEKEHFLFCTRWNLNIPRLEINNFLELAYAIKYSRFLLANQSLNWNIAEAMKTPRILEICAYAQNCIHGIGEDSYGFFENVGLEQHFRSMYNKTFGK